MLKGKVAIVTGGTSGMGRTFVEKLTLQGASVVFNGFPDDEPIDDIVDKLKTDKVKVFHHKADLKYLKEIEDMVDFTKKEFNNKIDILVNNAVYAPVYPLLNTTNQQLIDCVTIGFTAPFQLTKLVVPCMIEANWGRVINIASNLGLVGRKNQSIYSAVKHGLIGKTKSLAAEYGQNGITVNAICPGTTRTGLVTKTASGLAKKINSTEEKVIESWLEPTVTKTLIEPEEVANLVLLLCGELANNITGAALSIDGGYVCI